MILLIEAVQKNQDATFLLFFSTIGILATVAISVYSIIKVWRRP